VIPQPRDDPGQRVLTLTTSGKDAALTESVLTRAGLVTVACRDLEHVCELLEDGAAAVLVVEEAICSQQRNCLIDWRTREPEWSDLPVLVLARPGADSAAVAQAMDLLGNVTVLERPMRVAALVSAVRSALRARQRQYLLREKVVALRESEQRFRIIADAVPMLIWLSGTDKLCYFFNKAWLDFTGRTVEQESGNGWAEGVHPDDLRRCLDTYVQAFDARQVFEMEYRLRHHSGEHRWVFDRGVPRVDAEGAFQGYIGSVIDVHERKQAEVLLRQSESRLRVAKEEAETANRAKDQFLAVLSHELRTPLSPVVMTVAAMELSPDLPFTMRDDVTMIRRNIELETKLIDDLLDLSRITSGKMRLQMQPTRVHPLLHQAVQTCIGEMNARRQTVQIELRAANDAVNGDGARLQQVLWNLLRNATKFTPEGGTIFISTANTGVGKRNLRIQVRDTGMGIPPEVLPKVFDAFEQGDIKTTRHFGGLGLGLAICKAVLDMHGGTIRAASEGAGKGATFIVELPATVRRDEQRHVGQPDSHPSDAAHVRVLLVEDHPDTAYMLARLLKARCYDVKTAGTVAAALSLAASEPFDILVSDLGLPDGTGYELMEQIREHYGIRGIALSGFGMEEDQRRSREAGFTQHIVKPINVEQLEQVIRRVAGAPAGT